MKNSLMLLCFKASFIILSMILFLLPIVNYIHAYQKKHEPRSSLLNRVEMKGYQYALIGDSVFCSFYVSDNCDTIWKKFESITGFKMFPGALNGAKNSDIVNAAKYMSQKMPAHSTVFIDIIPNRLTLTEPGNYERQFSDLLQEEDYVVYKYFNYFDVEYITYISKYFSNKKYDSANKETNKEANKEQYNRQWNIDGDFAKNRYKSFLDKTTLDVSVENMRILRQIHELFRVKKINAVFVLTPLNKQQIYAYSDISKSDQVYSKLKEINLKTKKYLSEINATTIDLFDAVPSSCFADLVHTNVCGDQIIARSLTDYALKTKNKQ